MAAPKHLFLHLEPAVMDAELPVDWEINDREAWHHIKTVARFKAGDSLVVVDNQRETAYLAELVLFNKNSFTLKLLSRLPKPESSLPEIWLAAAMIKEQRWDWLLQKATELGVRRVMPLVTERTVVHSDQAGKKQDRWLTILKNAAEQSEGLFIPRLDPPENLASFLARPEVQAAGCKLLLVERGATRLAMREQLRQQTPTQPIILAIGPEGGWSEGEQAQIVSLGFHPISLGRRILRSETAAIAAMAVLVYETSDTGDTARV